MEKKSSMWRLLAPTTPRVLPYTGGETLRRRKSGWEEEEEGGGEGGGEGKEEEEEEEEKEEEEEENKKIGKGWKGEKSSQYKDKKREEEEENQLEEMEALKKKEEGREGESSVTPSLSCSTYKTNIFQIRAPVFPDRYPTRHSRHAEFLTICTCPTNNALLIIFRLNSAAEILLLSTDLAYKSGAKRAKTCMQCVHIPTELPFWIPPLVVGWLSHSSSHVYFDCQSGSPSCFCCSRPDITLALSVFTIGGYMTLPQAK